MTARNIRPLHIVIGLAASLCWVEIYDAAAGLVAVGPVDVVSLGTLDPGAPLAIEGTIGNGDHPEQDVDYFAVELTDATGPVLVTISVSAAAESFDPMVRLFDGAWAELERNDHRRFDDYSAEIVRYLVTPGTYYIGVNDAQNPNADPLVPGSGRPTNALGDYELTVSSTGADIPGSTNEPNDDVLNASGLGRISVTVSGEYIGDGEQADLDVDIFALDVRSAARLDVTALTSPHGSVLRPVIRLRSCTDSLPDRLPMDPCGLGESKPIGSDGRNASVSSLVLQPTTVYVMVSGEGNRRYDPSIPGSGELGSLGFYDLEVVVTPFAPQGPYEPNDSISQATEQPHPFVEGRPTSIMYEGYLGDGQYALTRGDRDFYQIIVADEMRLVTIQVEVDQASTVMRPVIAVFDQDKRMIAVNQNEGELPTATLTLPVACNAPLPEPSPLYVMIISTRQEWPADPRVPIVDWKSQTKQVDLTTSRSLGHTGSYRLIVTGEVLTEACGPEPNDTLATAVDTGLVDDGSWACFDAFVGDSLCDVPEQDIDYYSLRVDRAPVQLRVAVSTCAPESVALCDFFVRVLDSAGDTIAAWYSQSNCYAPRVPIPLVMLSQPGRYYVGVSGDWYGSHDPFQACSTGLADDTGRYELSLSLTPSRLDVFGGAAASSDVAMGTEFSELYVTRLDDAADAIDILDPATLESKGSLPSPERGFGGMEGLASDGEHVYFVGAGRYPFMYQLDPITGEVLDKTVMWMGSGYYSAAAILQDKLYLLDIGAHAIHRFDVVLQRYMGTWPLGWRRGITLAGGLAGLESPNRLYVADAFNTGSVYELHPSDGTLMRTLQLETASDQRPVNLSSSGSGTLLLTDRASDTVDVLDRNGNLIASLDLEHSAGSLGGTGTLGSSADANGDGNVDLRDFKLIQRCFGTDISMTCRGADLDQDGQIDSADAVDFVEKLTGP